MMELTKIVELLEESIAVPPEVLNRLKQHLNSRYQDVKDPWGLDIEVIQKALKVVYPIYKKYFQVRAIQIDKVKNEQYLFVSNHTGQIAFDGMLIGTALAVEHETPRIARAMIERWMARLPFVAEFTAHAGSILGDRKNCQYLIDQGESILIFPEGVRGISKNTKDFYQVQNFTTGFVKMALKKRIPILPIATIGAEEAYPFIYHPRALAKKFGLPALPLSPFMLLGPIGLMPLPSPVDIYFGDPIPIPENLNENSSEVEFKEFAASIQKKVVGLIKIGLKQRRPFLEKFGLEEKREL